MKTIHDLKKHLFIIGVLLSLVCMAYGQYPPAPQEGDYRTNAVNVWTSSSGTTLDHWQKYESGNWVNVTAPLPSPLNGNLYALNNIYVDSDLVVNGNIYSPTAGTKIEIDEGYNLTLTANKTYDMHHLIIGKGSTFVNYGIVNSANGSSSDIYVAPDPAKVLGGTLENHGVIHLDGVLTLNSRSKVISKEGATITGNGYVSTNDSGAIAEIANAGGYDEAFDLRVVYDAQGNNTADKMCFIFNGSQDQEAGLKLPTPICRLMVRSGHKLTLEKDIIVDGNLALSRVEVESGSTLDTGTFEIRSNASWSSNAPFILHYGATIITAHPDGISSETLPNQTKISKGAIQLNSASYNSGATYHFNGAAGQKSGKFVTTTDKQVKRIIMETPGGLELDPYFNPLKVTDYYQGTYIYNPPTFGWIDGQTLPVTLSYFNAYFNGFDSVMLQWETQSETNNMGFYVLRANDSEAASAKIISNLIQATNSSQGATYYFEDRDLYDDGVYYYWLQDVSFTGQVTLHGPITVQVTMGSGSNHVPDLPLTTSLVRNYPNPFNPSSQLEYYLEEGSDVSFEIYNLKGQKVDQFTLRNQTSGFNRHTWEPQLGSGTYIIKFTADGKSNTRKVVLSK